MFCLQCVHDQVKLIVDALLPNPNPNTLSTGKSLYNKLSLCGARGRYPVSSFFLSMHTIATLLLLLLCLVGCCLDVDAASLLGVGSKKEQGSCSSSTNIAQLSLLDATIQSLSQNQAEMEQAVRRDLSKMREEITDAVAMFERAKGSDAIQQISMSTLAGCIDEERLALAISNSSRALDAQIAANNESHVAAVLSLELKQEKSTSETIMMASRVSNETTRLRADLEELGSVLRAECLQGARDVRMDALALSNASDSKTSALSDAIEIHGYSLLAALSKLSAEASANITRLGDQLEISKSDLLTKIAIAEAYAAVLVNDSAMVQLKHYEDDSKALKQLIKEGLTTVATDSEASIRRLGEGIGETVQSVNSKSEGMREKMVELTGELASAKTSVATISNKQVVESALAEKQHEVLRSEMERLVRIQEGLLEKVEKQGMQLAAADALAQMQEKRISALEFILMNNKKQQDKL